QYGFGRLPAELRATAGADSIIVVDTGGVTGNQGELDLQMSKQVESAVLESHVVILMVDGESGMTAGDENVTELIRRTGKPVVLVVNKTEGRAADESAAEFHALGIGDPLAISATRGDRVQGMLETALRLCPPAKQDSLAQRDADGTRIAVIGKPNVGKSTLINRLLGEERLVTQGDAGTTRDSIAIPFDFDGQPFVLVDTAGIRRKSRVTEMIEKFSIVKSLQALEEADAVIMLIDAREGVTEQDTSLIGLILQRGRAITLGVNKWDGLGARRRSDLRDELDRQLPFLDFVDTHFISALHGSNIFDLLSSADKAAQAAVRDLPTSRLNEVLQEAIQAHPPPIVRRHRIKLSYAHQGGKRPPTIVIHGNQTQRLPGTYRRFLVNRFRKAFRLKGTPIRIELRTGRNPYEGRRNKLTPRQARSRERIRKRRR
ncbi:MAG: ribosome biogenesis GTPase Der, partial [Gammaproteobacteria bacterium]|nr:ribosome biogenesis GTPase Der [Gammaproteobacteria bacterium]